MNWLVLLFLILAFYFLSSGVAFASIYRYPNSAPKRLYGWFYYPMDLLASRVVMFQKIYNSYHNWCYRKLSGDNS
jgi:hypothetical protein